METSHLDEILSTESLACDCMINGSLMSVGSPTRKIYIARKISSILVTIMHSSSITKVVFFSW